MSNVVSESKLIGETLNVSIDFLSRLQVGESVQTAAVSIQVFSGIDANPSAMLSGSPIISGSLVTQKVIGGLPGVVYELFLYARTSLNNIPVQQTKIAVLSSPVVTPP